MRHLPPDPLIVGTGPTNALVTLFDCVDGVQFWIKDRTGRYRAMNRACLLDYSLASFAEAEGKTDFDLSPASRLYAALAGS